MSESAKPPVGETLAVLLDSADCPPSVRTAVINHLSELYEQSNLMHPQIVRMLYPVLQRQSGEAKAAESLAPRAVTSPVPFPLSVAQQQPPLATAPTASSAVAPAPPSIFTQPAQSAPAQPAANPFANRGPAMPQGNAS